MGKRGVPRRPIFDRIAERVEIQDDGCWLWQGRRSVQGYGVVSRGGKQGPGVPVHRALYEQVVEPVAKGVDLHHLCRVKLCVNPDHLEPLPKAEHMKLNQHAGKTYCKRGHGFTPENTRITSKGSRQCLECVRMVQRERYWRAKQYTDDDSAQRYRLAE